MNSGIYCIENIINNKKYIGFSSRLNKRWEEHKSCLNKGIGSRHLQHAWDLYGKDSFIWYIIEECPLNHLGEKEKFWISKLNTTNVLCGYNIEGGGNKNKIITKETREKISISGKGKHPLTGEKLEKMRNYHIGKKRPCPSSKYHGVHFDKKRKKWVASSKENNKLTWLGYYPNETKAAMSYNDYIIKNKISKPLNIILDY